MNTQTNTPEDKKPLYKALQERMKTGLTPSVLAMQEYSQLATDNLDNMAEALGNVLEFCKWIPMETFTEDGQANFKKALKEAGEALAKIS